MIYTFAVLQNPLKAVHDLNPKYQHYFGGELGKELGVHSPRYSRIITLDLEDPLLGFLRFNKLHELPLLMDFESGWISYSVGEDNSVSLHNPRIPSPESVLHEEPLPRSNFRLERLPYGEYRAAIFASAVFQDYLAPEDKAALERLGESYTQIGGYHARSQGYQPYCANPDCEGHGTQVTIQRATG
jgi:hypothetical protein